MGYANTKFKVGDRVKLKNSEGYILRDNQMTGEIIGIEYGKRTRYRVHIENCAYDLGFVAESLELETPHNEQFVLTRLFDAEAQIDELQRRVKELESQIAEKPTPSLTPNQRRADVIKQARAFVADLEERALDGDGSDGNEVFEYYATQLTFHVNADKGVVTALARGYGNGEIYGKAFARCAPGEVFNADIGKAIAAGRLYGVKVPEIYFNAPKPTEKVAGMVVEYAGKRVSLRPSSEKGVNWNSRGTAHVGSPIGKDSGIVDDTEAQY